MKSATKRLTASKVVAVVATILMLGVLAAPAAQAADITTSTTLGPSQTGDPDGTGNISLTFNPVTGEVCYTLTVANIDAPSAAHIHTGSAGSAGGVVVNFGSPIALGTKTCVLAGADMAAAITNVQRVTADPANFYVNVHNAAFPGGAIRGQIGALTATAAQASTTALAASGDPAGSGSTTITFDPDNAQVCYTLTTAGLASAAGAAHIHTGGPGVNGGVLINLDYATGQTGEKCVPATAPQINAVLADPNGFYVNVHTAGAPAGAIRGQVAATTAVTSTMSSGLNGAGFGDPDGSGTANFTLSPDGKICFTLTVANIGTPLAAHIHTGANGVQGGVLVNLDIAANGLSGCVTATAEAVAAIVADPAGHYVNVHTAAHPPGAIRGQLGATAPVPAPVAPPIHTPGVAAAEAGPGNITNPPVDGTAAVGPTTATTPELPAAAVPAAAAPGLAHTGAETPLLAAAAFTMLGLGLAASGLGRARSRHTDQD